jgi:hypothetical protein
VCATDNPKNKNRVPTSIPLPISVVGRCSAVDTTRQHMGIRNREQENHSPKRLTKRLPLLKHSVATQQKKVAVQTKRKRPIECPNPNRTTQLRIQPGIHTTHATLPVTATRRRRAIQRNITSGKSITYPFPANNLPNCHRRTHTAISHIKQPIPLMGIPVYSQQYLQNMDFMRNNITR